MYVLLNILFIRDQKGSNFPILPLLLTSKLPNSNDFVLKPFERYLHYESLVVIKPTSIH